jgi:ribonuclease VapC
MIAADTSALMAIVLDKPAAGPCIAALEAEDEILISAGTLAETLIVSARRNVGAEMARIIDRLAPDIVAVTPRCHGVSPRPINGGDEACTRQP